jgi:hypothetical protein
MQQWLTADLAGLLLRGCYPFLSEGALGMHMSGVGTLWASLQ